jgi:hypothetical protein
VVSRGGRTSDTPLLIVLGHLLSASRAVEAYKVTAADLAYLRGRSTSLGGMRPKCTVIDDDGALSIGKFPNIADERAVSKGEVLALTVADRVEQVLAVWRKTGRNAWSKCLSNSFRLRKSSNAARFSTGLPRLAMLYVIGFSVVTKTSELEFVGCALGRYWGAKCLRFKVLPRPSLVGRPLRLPAAFTAGKLVP